MANRISILAVIQTLLHPVDPIPKLQVAREALKRGSKVPLLSLVAGHASLEKGEQIPLKGK